MFVPNSVNIYYSTLLFSHSVSASCTHVSGLLHALVSITQEPFAAASGMSETEDEETPLPITSFACAWKPPRKRKETNARISDLKIEKHVYGRVRKHNLNSIGDFDPRPIEFQGTLRSCLPTYLERVKGKALGISILSDPTTQIWSDCVSSRRPGLTNQGSALGKSVGFYQNSRSVRRNNQGS